MRVDKLLMKARIDSFSLGFGLLCIPFFSLFFTSILFLLGFSLSSFVFPSSVIVSLLITFLFSKENWTNFIYSVLIFLIILVLTIFGACLLYDYSYDGQCYHQNIIHSIKIGWNPAYNHHANDAFPELALWVNHYAKGIEIIAASVYSFTGNIESGKAVNFIIILSSFFFVLDAIKLHFPDLAIKRKMFLSFIFTYSPVVANQFLTYYIDWSMYSLLLILISIFFTIFKREHFDRFMVIGMIIFLGWAIKFNIIFYIGIVVCIFLFTLYVGKNLQLFKKIIVTSGVSLFLGVCIAGFNPYITNILDHGNPFYPLLGKNSVEIMQDQTPVNMRDLSRLESIFISIFSAPSHDPKIPAKLAIPFYITKDSIISSGIPDVRVGGFGCFFSGILILSIIIYFFSFANSKKVRQYFNYLIISIVIAVFILPAGWWARYVPFFYFIPILMLLYSEYYRPQKSWILRLRSFVYFLIILNIGLSSSIVCGLSLINKTKVDYYLSVLNNSAPVLINFGINTSFKVKLENSNVKFVQTEKGGLDFEILGPKVYLNSSQLNFNKVEKPLLLKITAN
jgi:hypothetical protein